MITETIHEKPMSAEQYVKLRKLTAKDDEPIEDILHRVADELCGLKEEATIQLRLVRVGETTAKWVHSIQLAPGSAFLQPESITKPTLVVITTSESLRRVAEGSYSPVQAYLDGKMHLHGDVDLGKRVVLHLADSGSQVSLSQVSVCPFLDSPRWQPDGNGVTGSLTVTGLNFTPGGDIRITYDTGGAGTFIHDPVKADARGRFTVTQGKISCGDIPGKPGIGVIVTASDRSSGQKTSDGFPTPCS